MWRNGISILTESTGILINKVMKNLVQIQNELKVPKGNVNKFGNYRYRSAEDILEAVKPILAKYSATLTLSDDIQIVGEKIFLKASATLTVESESLTVNGFAQTSEHKGMSAEQTTGTASSYARKYALNGLFLIDETESDADSQPKQQTQNQAQPQKPTATIDRIRKAEQAIRELGRQVESFNPTGKNESDLKEELEALTAQYTRLKSN